MAVFLNETIDDEAYQYLTKRAEITNNFDNPDEIEGIILLYMPVDAQLMDRCKNLKVIGKHGVGCDSIDLKAARERGITVVNTPKANMRSVAEFISGLILDVAKRITESHLKTKEGNFETTSPLEMTGVELSGKTLGLVGAGNIAQEVARIMKNGYEMELLAYDPYISKEKLTSLGLKPCESLEDLVSQADIINVSVPLTDQTRNLISSDILDHFKEGSILINAARGGIVDEDALYEKLKDKTLAGAACDCFIKEPPTLENTKLFELANFVGTPHTASVTKEALNRMATQVIDDVLGVISGKEPVNKVV